MAKKIPDNTPFLSDEEVEDLQELDKKIKTAKPRTKRKEVIKEPNKEPEIIEKKPSKRKVITKKEPEKVVIVQQKKPEIDYVLKTVTKYDLNWYYLKEKLVRFKRWFFTPYTLYAQWFNKKFNTPKPIKEKVVVVGTKIGEENIEFENMEQAFEKIKQDKPDVSGMLKKHEGKIPTISKTKSNKTIIQDISIDEVELIFEIMKPEMIKQVHKQVNENIRKKVVSNV